MLQPSDSDLELEGDLEVAREGEVDEFESDNGCFKKYSRLPRLLRYFISLVAGEILFIGPATFFMLWKPATIPQLFNLDPASFNASNQLDLFPQLVRFLLWLGTIWAALVTWWYLIEKLPLMITKSIIWVFGQCSVATESNLEYIQVLHHYICIACWMITVVILYAILFPQYYFVSSWLQGFQFLCVLMVFSICIFFQRLFVQGIAVKFHEKVYCERIAASKRAIKMLDKLRKSIKGTGLTDMFGLEAISTGISKIALPALRKEQVEIPMDKHEDAAIMKSSTEAQELNQLVDEAEEKKLNDSVSKDLHKKIDSSVKIGGSEYNEKILSTKSFSDEHALKIAKKLFYALGKGSELNVTHFSQWFSTEKAAQKAFEIIDKDGNGSITKREMKQAVLFIYRERRTLFLALRDVSDALGKLNQILYSVSLFMTLFISLAIYGISLTALLPFTTIFIGFSFIFSGSARSAFDSIVFLFVTHPFDTGDKVIIDGITYKVNQLDLLTTVLLRGDGQRVYAPNAILSTKLIHNIRRSGDLSENIEFRIPFETSDEKIKALRDRMFNFLQTNSRDYACSCDVFVTEFDSHGTIKCCISLGYKGNWQDGTKRNQRKTAFLFELKRQMISLEIPLEHDN